jgi:glycosyltransferase involved in cell wall biosynthesis
LNTNKRPKVSIGLPVYNGEEYLAKTLDSVLAQTWTDYELIISDNGSRDATPEIISRYADADSRIRTYRFEKNLGAWRNLTKVFEEGRGEYFVFLSHDDLYEPEFLATAADVLSHDREALGCYARTEVIDSTGQQIKIIEIDERFASESPSERVAAAVFFAPPVIAFGFYRRSALECTSLFEPYAGSDRTFAIELALAGRLIGLDGTLFKYRRHDAQSYGSKYPNRRTRIAWWDPSKADARTYPTWRLVAEFFTRVRKAQIPITERISCFSSVGRWALRRRGILARELIDR